MRTRSHSCCCTSRATLQTRVRSAPGLHHHLHCKHRPDLQSTAAGGQRTHGHKTPGTKQANHCERVSAVLYRRANTRTHTHTHAHTHTLAHRQTDRQTDTHICCAPGTLKADLAVEARVVAVVPVLKMRRRFFLPRTSGASLCTRHRASVVLLCGQRDSIDTRRRTGKRCRTEKHNEEAHRHTEKRSRADTLVQRRKDSRCERRKRCKSQSQNDHSSSALTCECACVYVYVCMCVCVCVCLSL